MSKQLHSTVVARELLDLSADDLSQQQLQKLVYFAHGLYMIDDEKDGHRFYNRACAWSYNLLNCRFTPGLFCLKVTFCDTTTTNN